jgi:hypothetical protein
VSSDTSFSFDVLTAAECRLAGSLCLVKPGLETYILVHLRTRVTLYAGWSCLRPALTSSVRVFGNCGETKWLATSMVCLPKYRRLPYCFVVSRVADPDLARLPPPSQSTATSG